PDTHAVAAVAQVSGAVDVRPDQVAEQDVVDRRDAVDQDAVHRVAADEVARARGRAADGVVLHPLGGGDPLHEDAGAVGDGAGARGVGADAVALDQVVGGGAAPVIHLDADRVVPADQVAGPGCGAADGVAGPGRLCQQAEVVGQGGGAGGVGADPVTLDQV